MKKEEPLSTQKSRPKAAIYARVSTEEQAKQGFSLAAQEDALKNYAQALGYEIFKIYKDEGKSAKDIKHRPALQELLKAAQEKKFDAIFVYKLDRFSRSLKDLILTIEKLKNLGIDFISLQDKIETASASGKLMFHIISAFAEFERDIISERTRFGMTEKAKEGKVVTKAPFGYKIVNGKLEKDPNKAEQLKQIFETFLNTDISLTQLAKQNNMTTRGIIKLLKNKTYIGAIKFKKDYQGMHEAIISEEIFNKVQEKLKENSFSNTMKKNISLVQNILVQGDNRYNDFYSAKILAYFLTRKAIVIEKRQLSEIKEPTEQDLKNIKNLRDPQKLDKYIAFLLLKNEGFSEEEIFFERNFGDIPDVAAIKSEKEIFVECGPCRINKVIDYLAQNRELWVLTNGAFPWEKKPLYSYIKWFVFKKGPNWDEVYKEYKEKQIKLHNLKNSANDINLNENPVNEKSENEQNKNENKNEQNG